MATLNLVTDIEPVESMGLGTEKRRLLVIEASRVLFLIAILVVALAFQASQGPFISLDVWLPFYVLLMTSFVLNSIYLFLFDEMEGWHGWINSTLFAYDALFVTFLIYYTGTSQSIFLFLYLVNIILCGLVFQKRGSLLLALWTSILFSFLMIVGPSAQGQNLYFAVGLNNIAFFAVAYLGGLLSEQLNFMGSELVERQKDIEALRDLNQMIVDNMATGLLTMGLDGVITQVNQAANTILEDSRLLGRPLGELFPGIYESVDLAPIARGDIPSTRLELLYRNFRNEKAIIELTLGPLRDSSKEAVGYVMTFQDMTQVKKLEYAMRQQEKLAAVGQLAAGIAHEIRNPLASISGSIQLLSSSDAYGAEDKKLMNIVLREIDRLNHLISEFLDYVRPQTRIEDPINLNNLVQDIMEFVKNSTTLPQGVEQDISLKAARLIVGNKDKLKQALLNIVMNAYQAMDKSESKLIRVSTVDLDLASKVQLRIEDSGCGMDVANKDRIFEPFHTTKTNGTGLGLAISHKILESHGASVVVESEIGKGTTFVIEFPSPDGEKTLPPKRHIA
ncbi:MAG: PAS domain-containing protein [Bdellovibrionaceae bacterium]|nr:PAS domain-containing protein [Bdellovibrionales bacterium]MCB9085879.1 PAS domain-containing protein [Pseudobdellovibrionaceae bacterium]